MSRPPSIAPNVRRTLRHAAASVARVVPRPDPTARRVVLCYHSVHPSAPYASASPDEFAAHLDWLAASCDVVPLDVLVRTPNTSGRVQVALTFDDGYADNHEYALPLLASRGLTATFFVTAGFLERDPAVFDRLSTIWSTPHADLAPMAWSQVRELHDAGMRIGSHTWSHPNLAAIPIGQRAVELRRSKDMLEERLDTTVEDVAYPFGKLRENVDGHTYRLASEAGYRRGFVSLPRGLHSRDRVMAYPRFGVGPDTVSSLAAKVRGDIDWHATVHRRLPRRMHAALFPRYG